MLAILAAASILGARPLDLHDPARRAMTVHNQGVVLIRLDADGLVRARGCDGELRHVGDLSDPRRLHIQNDGTLDGLVWDARLDPAQRETFRAMMRAFGYSDHKALAAMCLPTTAEPQLRAAEISPDAAGSSGGRSTSSR